MPVFAFENAVEEGDIERIFKYPVPADGVNLNSNIIELSEKECLKSQNCVVRNCWVKRGVSAKAWGIRKIYRGAFIGSGRNSGKQLVFKKGRGSKQIKAVHRASLPREFERQNMEGIFNKKIKTRFPILFKRAVEFQMLKAKGRL